MVSHCFWRTGKNLNFVWSKYNSSKEACSLFGQLIVGGGRKKRAEVRSARRALTWLEMRLKASAAQERSGDEMWKVVVRVLQRNRTNRR